MTKLSVAAAVLATVISAPAYAGEWDFVSKNDPFDNTTTVTAVYPVRTDAVLFIACAHGGDGLSISMAVEEDVDKSVNLELIKSTFKIAIDGNVVLDSVDIDTSLHENNAGKYLWIAQLNSAEATAFVTAFGAAKDYVAVKEMMTEIVYNTSAAGTSAAALELNKCLDTQGKTL